MLFTLHCILYFYVACQLADNVTYIAHLRQKCQNSKFGIFDLLV
jgi:hypothetical protein